VYLIDTNHASLLFRQVPEVVAAFRMRSGAELSVCLPGVGELWYMVYNSQQQAANVAHMRTFLKQFRQLEFSPHAAEQFGIIKSDLRRRGKMIPDVDIQIASIAIALDVTLLTDDGHFHNVTGLKLENWLA
jgi:tRNA(fMet)-specific endonuclease VapC